jgi:hypothetical protein
LVVYGSDVLSVYVYVCVCVCVCVDLHEPNQGCCKATGYYLKVAQAWGRTQSPLDICGMAYGMAWGIPIQRAPERAPRAARTHMCSESTH